MTYSLDIILNTVCKNDKQREIVTRIFKDTIAIYQWYYQQAEPNRQHRDVKSGIDLATTAIVEHLRSIGQHTLADDVEKAICDDSILTRSKVVTQAKEYMKAKLLEAGMPEWKYTKHYAKFLEFAFIEWSEENQLTEPPAHFDDDFEPPIF